MLIAPEIGAKLALFQDFGQNRYSQHMTNQTKHLRDQPMGAINIVWSLEHFPYHITLLKSQSFGLEGQDPPR